MSPECFIVFSLLFVDDLFYFLNFFLIVTHDSPLDCLFLSFELPDHFLCSFHLVSLFLQVHIDLHVLFIYPSHESSLYEGLCLDLRSLHKVFFVLKLWRLSKVDLLLQYLDTRGILRLTNLLIISAGFIVIQIWRLKLSGAFSTTAEWNNALFKKELTFISIVSNSQWLRVSICLRSDLSTTNYHIFTTIINFNCVIIRKHESPVLIVQLYSLEDNRDKIV
jgi:hypothetical protein